MTKSEGWLQRVGWLQVDILRLHARPLVLPADVDILLLQLGWRAEADQIQGVAGDGLWAQSWQVRLIIGVTGGVTATGKVGLHHGPPSPAVEKDDKKE